MKSCVLLVVAFFTASVVLGQSALSLTIDPPASKVLWTATKMTGDHTGGVPVKSGAIDLSDTDLKSARITMDMTGITCLDVEDAGTNAKFVAHLKGADFFDVEKNTEASFTTTAVEKITDAAPGKPNYRVTGDLTIKGITQPNTFDCLFWMDGRTARAAANFTFDRAKYDIKYRSGTFFPEIGDKAISDTVSLTFDVSAK
ncbi:MAG TPA: YceI family protein [Flavobacteriales bacterium]|nr:YceI family protein [Flavobacteriales bacterium]